MTAVKRDVADILQTEGAAAVQARLDHDLGATRSTTALNAMLDVFEHWLLMADPTPIYAGLGAVAANYLDGDPVWLGLVGPPSSAKTEILNSASKLPHIVQAATLTPAALLSGTPKKQRDKSAKGGLLNQIGDFGIIACKDFGSILSMRPDAKAETLGALREVFDGEWTRRVGSDGGRELHWKGKVGLIFGSTGVIDSHHSVIGNMGDRFLLSRLAPIRDGQFRRALKHAGNVNAVMRRELQEAVVKLFDARRTEPRPITEPEIVQLERVTSLVVRLRGGIERDHHTREIQTVLGAEGPARLGLMLERLLAGLDVLGVERTTAMGVVKSVALDSVPPTRRAAFEFLDRCSKRNPLLPAAETSTVAKELGLPTNTVRRYLEDLAAHGLVERTSQGQGKPDLWLAIEESVE